MAILTEPWPEKHDRIAKSQGWSLFDECGFLGIERIDEPEDGEPQLRSDSHACDIVVLNAMRGCKTCILALYLDGRQNPEGKDFSLWVPDVLTCEA